MGDLNCTTGLDEVWGQARSIDSMSDMLKDIVFEYNLVDICPPWIVPTWDNGRVGLGYVAKRLDRFLIHEQMVE